METSPSLISITNENLMINDDGEANNATNNSSNIEGAVDMSESETSKSIGNDDNTEVNTSGSPAWYEDLADALTGANKRCDLSVVRKITNCEVFPPQLRLDAWLACLGAPTECQLYVAAPTNKNDDDDEADSTVRYLIKQAFEVGKQDDAEKLQLFNVVLSSLTSEGARPCNRRQLQSEFVPVIDVIVDVATKNKSSNAASADSLVRTLFLSILDFIPANVNSALQLLRLIVQYHEPELSLFLDSNKVFAPAKKKVSSQKRTTSTNSTTTTTKTVLERCLLSLLASDVKSHQAVISFWDMYFQYHDPYMIFFVILVLLINIKDSLLTHSSSTAATTDDSVIENAIANVLQSLDPSDVPDCMALALFYSQHTPSSFRACCYSELFETSAQSTPTTTPKSKQLPPVAYKSHMHIPVDQALCLPVTAEELLESLYMPDEATASGSSASSSSMGNHSQQQSSSSAASASTPLSASTSGLKFFIIDCRSSDDYNDCHLSMAFHLEASLICSDHVNFETALDTLLQHQAEAVDAKQHALVGQHICFLGSGGNSAGSNDMQEDQFMFMVQSRLLQRAKKLVSFLDGGFAEIISYCSELDLIGREELLHGSHVNKYLPLPPHSPSHRGGAGNSNQQQQQQQGSSTKQRFWASTNAATSQEGWGKFIKTLVTHVKHQAEEYKEKLETYMDPYIEAVRSPATTPTADATPPYDSAECYEEDDNSSSAADRRLASVSHRPRAFNSPTSTENDGGMSSPPKRQQQRQQAKSAYEYVNMADFLKQCEPILLAQFRAGEILQALGEQPPLPCTLVLTTTQLVIMRHLTQQQQQQFEHAHINGSIVARRPLDSIVKITAKKQYPEVVTIKYGTVHGDDEFHVTNLDRLFIPDAKHAVERIKHAVLALCEDTTNYSSSSANTDNNKNYGGDGEEYGRGTSCAEEYESVEMSESTMEIDGNHQSPSSVAISKSLPPSSSASAVVDVSATTQDAGAAVTGSSSAMSLSSGGGAENESSSNIPKSSSFIMNENDAGLLLPSSVGPDETSTKGAGVTTNTTTSAEDGLFSI